MGVQPGPFDSEGKVCPGVEDQGFTSIGVAKQVADWTKKHLYAGVMLYSYSTDAVEYAGCPRPPKEKGWPNKDDHAWQKAITSVLTAK